MALKRLHDTTYYNNAKKLTQTDQSLRPRLFLMILVLSVLYFTGIVSLSFYAMFLAIVISTHVFIFTRHAFFMKKDKQLRARATGESNE